MNADWNSFFSTLSQSAAAIVGIFGAFIITKIFSNQTVFHEKKAKLRDLLVHAKKISDNANSYNVTWYNNHYNKYEYIKFHEYLDEHFSTCESVKEISDEILDDFIFNNKFSNLTERSEILFELRIIMLAVFEENKASREKREADEREEAERAKITKGPFGNYLTSLNMSAMVSASSNFSQMGMYGYEGGRPLYGVCSTVGEAPRGALGDFEDEFCKCYREAKHHSRVSKDFLTTIIGNPESPRQIAYSLGLVLIIFFLGIIYPLSFIPTTGKPVLGFSWTIISENLFSFKGFLLCIISSAFSITVALFLHTHTRMKYPQSEVNEVEKLTEVTHYCSTFKFLDEEDDHHISL